MSTERPRMTRIMRVMRALNFSLLVVLGLLLSLIRLYPYAYDFPSFPRLTRTHTGAAGDPLNVIIVGSQQQVTHSFGQAGWLVPDPITPQTSAKIAADGLAHRSYPTAPVSNLYVFGRAQDLAFEKPTNDVQNRGHIRLWETGIRIGGQPVWVGQASYDHGIELSGTNGLPTHHILPTVDLERDSVGTDLERTGLVVTETSGAFTPPIFVAHNGGGDYYESDGDVLVITYTHASLPLTISSGLARVVTELKRSAFRLYDTLLTTLPIALAVGLMCVAMLVVGLWPGLRWLRQQASVYGSRDR